MKKLVGISGATLAFATDMPNREYAENETAVRGPNPKKLEQRLAEAARARGFSLETEKAYWMWVRQFILYFEMRGLGDGVFLGKWALDRENGALDRGNRGLIRRKWALDRGNTLGIR